MATTIPVPCDLLTAYRRQADLLDEWLRPQGTADVPVSIRALLMIHGDAEVQSKLGTADYTRSHILSLLPSIAVWRGTQFIFTFDPEMFEALAGTHSDVVLDSRIVRRLPAPCVWIDTPFDDFDGFFATLDYVGNDVTGVDELALWLVFVKHKAHTDSWEVVSYVLGLDVPLNKTITDAYSHATEEARATILATAAPAISLVLYLCSEEPEVTGRMSRLNKQRSIRKQPLYGPTMFHVGARFGAVFRKAKLEHAAGIVRGEASSPVPHMRRAHWHAYWMGPKNKPEQRRRVLKWLHPIAVNTHGGDAQAAIRPVK